MSTFHVHVVLTAVIAVDGADTADEAEAYVLAKAAADEISVYRFDPRKLTVADTVAVGTPDAYVYVEKAQA